LKEEKLEQLRNAFKNIINQAFFEAKILYVGDINKQRIIDSLIYEVKIRATERKE